jgi:hypothetical protein
MADFRDSVARLVISGGHVGSAWVLAPDIACTARHCVAELDQNSTVTLEFPSGPITGTNIQSDLNLDVALIEVNPKSHRLTPLELIARPITLTASTQWKLHGYPVEHVDSHRNGLTLDGTVTNSRTGTADNPLMQLYCQQGHRVIGQNSPFGGVSGCPVVVHPREDDETVFVIGVTSHHHLAQDDILFCTPIDEVVARLGHRVSGVQIRSWDAYRRVLSIACDKNGYRTNLDEHMMLAVWQHGLAGLWCNIMPDESPILTSALERIIVQSPGATSRASTDLHLAGAAAWESRCHHCATDWVPVDGVPTRRALARYRFVELSGQAMPLGGLRFGRIEDLAKHLKSLCNEWALNRLRVRVSEALDNPLGELQYDIAPDLIAPMRKLWTDWLAILKDDSDTLHHFFGLMLCGDGDVLMAESAAGTGPETIDACILRATMFSLAVCAALPTELHSPRGQSPGNLGLDEMTGHSCGIQTLSGKRIQMADKSHKWKTLFVFLPQRQIPWEVYRVAEARLDAELGESAKPFSQEPANSLVLPGDLHLMHAIETGRDALKSLLEQRYREFLVAQERYVAEAKDVSV